jgi:hypothetical protein
LSPATCLSLPGWNRLARAFGSRGEDHGGGATRKHGARLNLWPIGDLLDSTTMSAWALPTGHAFYQIRKAGKALDLKVLPVCWRWSTSDRMKGRELIIPARRRRKTRVRLWAFSDVALGAGVVDALA